MNNDIRTTGFTVPSLTIKPIVENAVKYGVSRKEGGGTVKIMTWEEPSCFMVQVADDGVGFDPAQKQYDGRSHIGIDNVRCRLAIISHAAMTIDSMKGVGTTVTISIPKEFGQVSDKE